MAGIADPAQRRAAVEQMVRTRLLALDAEEARLHRSPEFLRRYADELARLQLEKAFEEPFKKQLPTADEVRKFFDENKARLGRPERVRVAHLALLAPAGDLAARESKRAEAHKVLPVVLRDAKDEYAFGRLALTLSDDLRSRPAAGELPFATREELAARLGHAVAEAAFAAKPGQVVDRVIETEHGFQLLKVLAHEEGQEARFEDLREGIRARLTAERHEKALKEFLDARWARADVKIDDEALAQIQAEKSKQAAR
ncbi:peptidylprolyl isomerase [Anaeromyxobacter oryzisoli]|uniref:peptidylprolyl isomerase n=1 Tax=Anaeromyxobacter oryzisoli TaxID=2925408 RepID=UPI001F56E4BB|nr:peptidyl-prolyl cis-trans isomerase [Anaeromyxobacter sp. SG63]